MIIYLYKNIGGDFQYYDSQFNRLSDNNIERRFYRQEDSMSIEWIHLTVNAILRSLFICILKIYEN